MTTTEPTQQRWDIQRLLANSIQPFDDLPDDELEAMARGISRRRPLPVPVIVTPDGTLIDGHQRLRILLGQGQKSIGARDVRVDESATADNALERAVVLNFRRRHLTADDKGRLALKLMRTYGWSQGRVADVLDVHRPQVSRWLKGIGASTDAEDPDLIIPAVNTGRDGGTREVAKINAGRAPGKPKPHPWSRRGADLADVARITRRVQAVEAFDALTADERVILRERLEDLGAALAAAVDYLTGDQ